ncbi:hypothetical protein TPHA_0D01780 [Tetrapisispora phaffii CBS 4417]|uniref:Mediator of RNA polymerase II transcription subunit 20 n=1 Tax=Tetrapisispora phaffii (strain ATCC 24235 / CBS 4417 / NBRC 1672 / NRRL Y-8282 / UCD 70-5) TaxID=1071381 RepID=G8BSJ6_TETPH|nr:hypothetical protein TPHA_0D01780 [Tetrapisispora phaffii CBS 4417]CCE62817.1 hypothetical protein TPHA_0D01780 [Tetrapisispora phaffii CBS 4417]
MTRTAVIFNEKATPDALVEFKDALSNTLTSILEPWSLEFKTFRKTTKNERSSNSSNIMYSVSFAHHDKGTVLIHDKYAIITTNNSNDIPKDLILNTCSTGTTEPIDNLLALRLSNIWSQRQGIRGDAGETLQTTNLIVRVVNLFSSTGFKGLLIELNSLDDDVSEEEFKISVDHVQTVLKDINCKDFKLSTDRLNFNENNGNRKLNILSDLAYQYIQVLEY